MIESTTPRYPTIRVNLLRAHGSPTGYFYVKGCRCALCRAAQSTRDAAYYVAHREEILAGKAERRAAHPEILTRMAAYAAAHREEIAARKAAYNVAHPEIYAANCRKRRARKYNASGHHTASDALAQHARQRGRCFWCGVKVSWRKKHIDHVVPLAGERESSDGPENIVIACPSCNQSKGAKHPMDFAGILF